MLEDCLKGIEVGQQFALEDIRLIGTTDYTCIGRPTISNARVIVTLEEKPQSEKVIIFKKRRRKGYQKNAGHSQLLTVLKVDRIEHNIDESDLS